MHSVRFIDMGIYLVVNSDSRIRMYISLMERKISSYLLSHTIAVYTYTIRTIFLITNRTFDLYYIRNRLVYHSRDINDIRKQKKLISRIQAFMKLF